MPDRSAKTTVVQAGTIATTTETVVAVLTIPSDSTPDQQVELSGNVDLVAGTGATALQLKIRRGGTVTGTIVGSNEAATVVAGNTVQAGVEAIDTPGLEAGLQYALTVQQTGATGNATVNAASLEAILP